MEEGRKEGTAPQTKLPNDSTNTKQIPFKSPNTTLCPSTLKQNTAHTHKLRKPKTDPFLHRSFWTHFAAFLPCRAPLLCAGCVRCVPLYCIYVCCWLVMWFYVCVCVCVCERFVVVVERAKTASQHVLLCLSSVSVETCSPSFNPFYHHNSLSFSFLPLHLLCPSFLTQHSHIQLITCLIQTHPQLG